MVAAVPRTTLRAIVGVGGDERPHSDRARSLARATASSIVAYGITVFTGPKASMSCGSVRLNGVVAHQQHRARRTRPCRDRRRPR